MRGLRRFLISVAIVGALLVGVGRAVAIRWWRVPDNDPYLEASIAPTLRGGDWILLWRLTEPHLGDLVLCPEPKAPERAVIARIAATEGETFEIRAGQVRIDGHRVRSGSGCPDRFSTVDPASRVTQEQTCSTEQLRGREHQFGERIGDSGQDVTVTVPSGQVFLLSDNRQFPYDSRDFGSVDRASCKETVILRLLGRGGYRDSTTRFTLVR